MNILSWIKGIKKKREVQKLEPDKEFKFEENYYGKIEILNGFKILYYTDYDKLFNSSKSNLSFISCIISIPKNNKTINDTINFINIYIILLKSQITNSLLDYDNININITEENINIFIRGNIDFYRIICDNIYNNIITKYIRNNLFPNIFPINCPNEFLNNVYNSIKNPCKEIDILFIENNIMCKSFNPVIGLSISTYLNENTSSFLKDKWYEVYNNRYIIYCSIDKLSDENIDYLINNVKHGNKLLDYVHKSIDENNMNIDLNIDEIL